MLKLFYSPGSCATASHIALEEAGADYELELVKLGEQQQRTPEYLTLNPKGRVPALATDRGVLTENPAILAYVAQTWPNRAAAVPFSRPMRSHSAAGSPLPGSNPTSAQRIANRDATEVPGSPACSTAFRRASGRERSCEAAAMARWSSIRSCSVVT